VNYGLLVQVASSLREHVRDIRDGQAVLAYRYAEEDYFGGNAVNVATLAQLLAEAHGCDDETVVQAMVAGLLHDIGFVSMGSRDFDSPIAIGEHCGAGAQLARRIGAPSLVLKILQQHEEHADGSGLPARLPASEIAPEAQFVLAAVTYSNLFTGRVLQDPIRRQREYRGVPLRVDDPLTTILQDLKRWFRPDVLKVLILQYGFYSPGTLVQLNNKSVARVIGQNPGKPTTPVVEIVYRADGSRPEDMTLVDLSREAALAIAKVLSFEQIQ
jgi:putative nucleotidyltransferase with HDIG domain